MKCQVVQRFLALPRSCMLGTLPQGHKDMLPSRSTAAVALGRVELEVRLGRPHAP